MNYFIKNATLVNEGETFRASVFVKDGKIDRILKGEEPFGCGSETVIDAKGKYLLPGLIDEHVHFREPGLTQKADLYTESRAAVAGGVTSFMDMPNTNPQTVTQALLQQKFGLAAEKSLANYSFYLGATNDNIDEILKTDPRKVCGIKVFMGSSTGNMLVDDNSVLGRIFRESPCLVAVHCEDEETIHCNTVRCKDLVAKGEAVADAGIHPFIRTSEACLKSATKAVWMAERTGARLHVLHVSTKAELALFRNDIPLSEKKITAETCPHYLFFHDHDYETLGYAIKCNPAIKRASDREALIRAAGVGLIDTIGTDHAPHLLNEKFTDDYFTSKSGFPSIQHSLEVMAHVYRDAEGKVDWPLLVRLMCHNPAVLYQIDRRGFLREGYFADLVLVDADKKHRIADEMEYSKCGWTPYKDLEACPEVTHTFVNGNLVYENGIFHEEDKGERLIFNR